MTQLSPTDITCQELTFECEDGTVLAGSFYRPGKAKSLGAVMLGPATGIRRQFYHHFAHFLAAAGFAVLTYDNRGI